MFQLPGYRRRPGAGAIAITDPDTSTDPKPLPHAGTAGTGSNRATSEPAAVGRHGEPKPATRGSGRVLRLGVA